MNEMISFLIFLFLLSAVYFGVGFGVVFIPVSMRKRSQKRYEFDKPSEYVFKIDKESTPLPNAGIDGSNAVDLFKK